MNKFYTEASVGVSPTKSISSLLKSSYWSIWAKFLSKYFGTNENFIYLPPQKVNKAEMKADIHPKNYRMVVFKDMSNDYSFITRSTVDTKETVKWEDGNEYPLFKLEISHKSHPFFTGTNMLIDTAGRIDKFNKRYAKKK